MSKILVDGKWIDVTDQIDRPKPSDTYEHVYADLFDIDALVEKAKKSFTQNHPTIKNIEDIPEEVEKYIKKKIVDSINESIEIQEERILLFRNFSKSSCQSIIDKYEKKVLSLSVSKKELSRKMKKYSHILEMTEEEIEKYENKSDVFELEALYIEWKTQDDLELKYLSSIRDYENLKEKAKK